MNTKAVKRDTGVSKVAPLAILQLAVYGKPEMKAVELKALVESEATYSYTAPSAHASKQIWRG